MALAATLATAMLVAGCSSDDSDGAPNGDTIVLGTAIPLTSDSLTQPQLKAALEASVKAVNADGGIAGKQVELKVCDTQYSVNQELGCTRELVSAKVSAIVTPTIIADQSGAEYELTSRAGIPVVGTGGLTPADFNTEGVFPIGPGIPGWVEGAIEHLLSTGSKKIALVATAGEAGSEFAQSLAVEALKKAGVKPVATVRQDTDADPTFAAAAAEATADGVDGIFLATSPALTPKAVLALRQGGYDGAISSITVTFGPAILEALGKNAEGLLLTSQGALIADEENAEIKAMLAAMDKYAPDAEIDELTVWAWSTIQLLKNVMEDSDDTSSAAIMEAFKSLTSVEVGSIGPFGQPKSPPYVESFPRIYNPTVFNGVVKDGITVPDGRGAVNPFEELAAYSN
ncbi:MULTISPECIES: ABC transporter substrate-binding protein [unclassified Nocardioides]|uniref:ABC transporter substrate-binding protein n=1 Tax=unclassified Nocardioides TaxID=2615069 RepID=UPI0006F7E45A|nr:MULTISPECIES: ABC transporter substrate-binding protein [unclassified Nocardioides]KRA31074.1 hypothetical protein ASD81_16430 [Nocardioides sp. Root614]KRA87694.1 hypothetical protein ASD84_16700 [Nocardioides sp. Root682]